MTSKRTVRLSLKILRKKFRRGMTVRKYRDKEVVFSQGDRADAVYHIQDGTVKLTAVSTRRKKAIIAFLQRGKLFWRRLSGRAIPTDLHGEINWAVQYRPTVKGEHGRYPGARRAACGAVC